MRLSLLFAALLALAPARAAEKRGVELPTGPTLTVSGPGQSAAQVPSLAAVPPLGAPLQPSLAAAPGTAALPAAARPVSAIAAPPALAASVLPSASAPAAASAPDGKAGPAPAAASPGDAEAHPVIQHAREEARKLGVAAEPGADPDAAAAALAPLKTSGWAKVKAGVLVTAGFARRIGESVQKLSRLSGKSDRQTLELKEDRRDWKLDLGGDSHGRGGAKELLETIGTALQKALPGEPLMLRDAQIRLSRGDSHERDFLHVDGGYITVTIALKGPGTALYPIAADGATDELVAGLEEVAVLTNEHRRRATGIPGTVHSSPSPRFYRPGLDDERWLLIARFDRVGQERASAEEQAILNEYKQRLVARVQKYRDAKERALGLRPAPSKGWLDFVKRLLE